MALARVKSWIAGEVLNASDLNAEFNNLLNNPIDFWSPATKAASMATFALYFDGSSAVSLSSASASAGLVLAGAALNTAQGTDIVAAATINLDTATGNLVDVTGNTGITAVTLSQGRLRWVRFTGTPTITHSSSLVVEGGADYTAVAGQFVLFIGYASSVVRCIPYTTPAATQTLTNKTLTNPANTTQALTDGASVAWDASLGSVATLTIAGNRTMAAPSNLKTGGTYVLHVTQDGTGGRTLAFNAVFKNQGGASTIRQPALALSTRTTYVFESPDGTNLQLININRGPTSTALTSGTAATYTPPTGATRLRVRGVGPGGGGGGCATAGAAAAAAEGGGSGAYFEKLISSPSASYTYTIGTGGGGGSAGNNAGSDGSAATSFTDGTLTLSAAAGKGGSGGGAAASYLLTGSLATGGVTASGGDINIPGTAGGLGFVGSATQANGGAGGASLLGASVRNAVNTSAAGVTGANYGSGGSGGQDVSNTSTRAGGNGAPGVIFVDEFYE